MSKHTELTPSIGNEPLGVSMIKMKENAKATGKKLNYAGLQILNSLDGLYVHQEWEILEQLTNWYEASNEYSVFDKDGKVRLFKAKEKTCCCYRLCCGENRGFRIKVYDQTGSKDKAMMVIKRKYRCCGCAIFPCCAHRVDVHLLVDEDGNEIAHESSDTLISRIQVPWFHGGCCVPTWHISDDEGVHKGTIKGPCCFVCDCCGSDFGITDPNGNHIGKIDKLAPKSLKSLAIEMATDADYFKIDFNKDLEPSIKMAILASTLQIDFTFFEDSRGPYQGRCCDVWLCGWPCPCMPGCLCCCCKSDDEKKKKEKEKGAPESEEMIR
jgi:hypothetical protein